MQSLQRRPARTPYVIATLFTALWAIAGAALAYGFGEHLRQMIAEAGLAPTVIGLAGALGGPVVFFFALASMIARLNELRIVSSSMAEATLRFAQPETAAHDSIMSIGQAIRREVAAMGDGVERALARAVELESLVNNEVAVLERAYSENEVRIRNLLAGLAQQREILVGQAEQVRDAITHVHLDLSQDITTVSELIAERVNETAQRVTQALADKGEQITVALGTAGDGMIEQLGVRGASLLKQLETTSESTTHAIDAAGERMTTGLNFKSDQISEQVLTISTGLQQSLATRLDEVVGGFSQKSASVLATVENRTRELSDSISVRSETVSQALMETTGRIAETIAARADEVNKSLKTTGESIVLDLSLRGTDMVSKLEGIGQKITEQIVSRGDFLTQQFGSQAETLATSVASRSDMMRDMLAQRLDAFERMFSHDGAELADRIARDSSQLGELITRHLAEFDNTVRNQGVDLVDGIAQRTADLQELVAAAVTTRDDTLTASVAKAVSEVEASTKTAAELAASSIERIAHEVGTRTGAAVERAAILVGKATEAIESRTQAAAEFAASRLASVAQELELRSVAATEEVTIKVTRATETIEGRAHAAADFAASRLTEATEHIETRAVAVTEDLTLRIRSATEEIGQNTTQAFGDLLERSGIVSEELQTRAQSAADLMQARAADLQNLMDAASNRLIDAISTKGGQFAAEIEQAADDAARAIDNKAFAFTQSMMNNSNELARVITDASNSAAAIVNRTLKELQDSTRNSVSQATIMVAQILKELQQTTKGAIEQSKDVAISTVSEIHETHDMLRSDTTALFERLRDANDMLQSVLGGARSNLNAIEQVLSGRVVEFVSTVERLLESTDSASGKLDRQVDSFNGLTSRVLGDLGELAVQFDGHGRALSDAVAMLERANDDTLASVSGRRSAIEQLAVAMDNRTEQLDSHLKRFSNMIDVSLRAAEDRARDAARLVAEATSEGARTLAERHAAIRSTTEQESKQTLASLRELHMKVSSETKDIFQQNAGEANVLLQQATDRFAETMHSMKKMSVDMQRELETTRKELRRGVLELPEETAESMAQMRRVIVDQMEALAELNRIVARHGRAMDAVGTPAADQPRRGYGEDDSVMSSTLPDQSRGDPARGRGPVAAPAAGTTDWNSLQRSNRTEAPRPEQPPAADWNSLQRGRTAEAAPEQPAARPAAPGPDRVAGSRSRADPPPEPPASRPPSPASRGRGEPDARPAAPRGRGEPQSESARPAASPDWTARGRVEPPPPEAPVSRPAANGGSDWAASRGRVEPPGRGRGEPEPPPSWPAAGAERNGNQRGRIDVPREPHQPDASDWTAPPSRGAFEAPPVAPVAPEAPTKAAEGDGGWLSNLLTRASRDGEEQAGSDERGSAAKPARPAATKERMHPDDDRNLRLGIDSVDQLSADIGRWIDHEAAADIWERYNHGERNVSTRRLYTPQGRKVFEEMRKRYKTDREFRQAVDRYVGQFDRFLGDVGHETGGPALARNYITSEAGKVYTMLAHAAGRFE
jgi:hypothetical protein